QVVTGGTAPGAELKDAKEQLRALPDPLTYGLLCYKQKATDEVAQCLVGSDVWTAAAAAA
ncbi:hypothetical protein, partial [Serratia marcescens]|uniref:hypothetical protein n=1 Tax=Serratia marcescens TaxID=615 RepID=UPI001A9F838C